MRKYHGLPGLLRAIYTENPFYLLSACLVLYGVRVAFQPAAGELIDPWSVMSALCGYSLLIALTSFLIVRFGRVWEDARSLFFILLLLFLAISVSFDEIVNRAPETGKQLMLFGFCFAGLITECLLRSLRISFPLLYRVPYYLILALFFSYPLWSSPATVGQIQSIVRWRIALFPTVASLLFLTLIPAIRRGAGYVANNGTPWRWPWFPWVVFGFLGFVVCFRAYVLSLSFDDAIALQSAFGLYYLVPFGLSGLVLLLEVGLVEGSRRVQRLAVGLAPLLLLLSVPMPTGSLAYADFLDQFVQKAGSPVFLTAAALCVFFCYTWFRRVAWSETLLVTTLLLTSVVGPHTVSFETLAAPQSWALLLVAGIELVLAVIRGNSFRCFFGLGSSVAAVTVQFWDTPFLAYNGVIPYHLMLAVALGVGLCYKDWFAAFLRHAGAVLLPLSCIAALSIDGEVAPPQWARLSYVSAVTAGSFAYWVLTRQLWHLYAGFVSLASGGVALLGTSYDALRDIFGTRGLAPLAWGAVCFVVAALISALKGGLDQKVQSWLTLFVGGNQQGDNGSGSG